jgi:hypothetical protein
MSIWSVSQTDPGKLEEIKCPTICCAWPVGIIAKTFGRSLMSVTEIGKESSALVYKLKFRNGV